MMKAGGQKRTHIDEFEIYLKSEFLDFVYLQQNTFDEVDAASSLERQRYCFDKVVNVLKTKFTFDSKDSARRFFQELRVAFTELNYMPFKSEKFVAQEKAIESKIVERAANA